MSSEAANESGCPTCGIFTQLEAGRAVPKLSVDTPCIAELRTINFPPSDTDASTIRSAVQESRTLLHALDAQIARAEATLTNLNALRTGLLAEVSNAEAVLHPIRFLPNEILAHIFLDCAPDYPTSANPVILKDTDTLHPRNYPWNLSHVSRRWRDVALTLPHLWSTIYLNLELYEGLSFNQLALKGRLLFDRAANQELALNIFSWDKVFPGYPLLASLRASTTIVVFNASRVVLDNTFAKCLGHMKSLKELSLEVLQNNFTLIQPLIVLPLLNTLTLKESPDGDSEMNALLYALNGLSLPSMTVFCLVVCDQWELVLPASHPDFHRLISLEVLNCTDEGDEYEANMAAVLDFLELLPALETLCFTDCLVSSVLFERLAITPQDGLPVILPNLRHLDMLVCDVDRTDPEFWDSLLTCLESRAPSGGATDGGRQPFRKLMEVEMDDSKVELDEDEAERWEELERRMSLRRAHYDSDFDHWYWYE